MYFSGKIRIVLICRLLYFVPYSRIITVDILVQYGAELNFREKPGKTA